MVFMVCRECRAVVPKWRLIRAKYNLKEMGCSRCGSLYCGVQQISELRAAMHVLIRGYFWRRLIRRKEDWEPRVPWRHETDSPY